jgi:hypothetical protein
MSDLVHAHGGPNRTACGLPGGVTGAFRGAPSEVTCPECFTSTFFEQVAEVHAILAEANRTDEPQRVQRPPDAP